MWGVPSYQMIADVDQSLQTGYLLDWPHHYSSQIVVLKSLPTLNNTMSLAEFVFLRENNRESLNHAFIWKVKTD